jgi:hypothetical protein
VPQVLAGVERNVAVRRCSAKAGYEQHRDDDQHRRDEQPAIEIADLELIRERGDGQRDAAEPGEQAQGIEWMTAHRHRSTSCSGAMRRTSIVPKPITASTVSVPPLGRPWRT